MDLLRLCLRCELNHLFLLFRLLPSTNRIIYVGGAILKEYSTALFFFSFCHNRKIANSYFRWGLSAPLFFCCRFCKWSRLVSSGFYLYPPLLRLRSLATIIFIFIEFSFHSYSFVVLQSSTVFNPSIPNHVSIFLFLLYVFVCFIVKEKKSTTKKKSFLLWEFY